ncbi:MAG: NIPSNAP family protein, partial [Pirellulales bacterium]
QDKPQSRLFEMRTYITEEGRLDALNRRFREHTNKLFVKHGMTLVGYWTPADGPDAKNTLVYILAYPKRDAREASWKAFAADPDWKAAREASEADGKIVKKVEVKYLTPTDYSPIK